MPQEPTQQPVQNQPPQQSQEGTQQQYDVIASLMAKHIYSDKGDKVIQQAIKMDQPEVRLSVLIGNMCKTASDAGVRKGVPVPPKVMLQAAQSAAKALEELLVAAGLPQERAGQIAKNSLFMGLKQFADSAKSLSPERRQQYLQILQQTVGKQAEAEQQAPNNGANTPKDSAIAPTKQEGM